MTLAPIPTLDEIAAHPERPLLPDVARALLIPAKTAAAVVERWALEGSANGIAAAPDRTLRLDEAAPRLGLAIKTLARWTRTKPEWAACVVSRSQNRILLSASRFEATLRDHVAGEMAPPPRGARRPRARINPHFSLR